MQADLERLLQKRGSFDALRGTLSRLIAKEQHQHAAGAGAGAGGRAGTAAGARPGAAAGPSTHSSFAAAARGVSGGLVAASLMQPSRTAAAK